MSHRMQQRNGNREEGGKKSRWVMKNKCFLSAGGGEMKKKHKLNFSWLRELKQLEQSREMGGKKNEPFITATDNFN